MQCTQSCTQTCFRVYILSFAWRSPVERRAAADLVVFVIWSSVALRVCGETDFVSESHTRRNHCGRLKKQIKENISKQLWQRQNPSGWITQKTDSVIIQESGKEYDANMLYWLKWQHYVNHYVEPKKIYELVHRRYIQYKEKFGKICNRVIPYFINWMRNYNPAKNIHIWLRFQDSLCK